MRRKVWSWIIYTHVSKSNPEAVMQGSSEYAGGVETTDIRPSNCMPVGKDPCI